MKRAVQINKGDQVRIRLPTDDPATDEETVEFIALPRSTNGFRLQATDGGKIRLFRDIEMWKHVMEGRVDRVLDFGTERIVLMRPIAREWDCLNAEQRNRADRRVSCCNAFRLHYPKSDSNRSKLKRFVQENGSNSSFPMMLSWQRLGAWLNIYRPGDPPVVLADERRQKVPRFSEDVAAVVDEIIDKCYMTSRPAPVKGIHSSITDEIDAINRKRQSDNPGASLLVAPSYPTICRVIKKLDAFEVEKNQKSLEVAEEKFKIRGTVDWVHHAGALVAIDATQIDLYIVDVDGYPFRPWWTVVQCVVTGIILGWCFSVNRPNVAVIIGALGHAMMRKPSMAKLFGGFVKNEFEFFGKPQGVLLDNALEHLSDELSQRLKIIGIVNIEFTRTYDPTKRGGIERYFHTMNGALFHRLPGAVRHAPGKKPLVAPKKGASLPFAELDRLVHKFVVDIHPNRYVKRLKKRRIDRWLDDRQKVPVNELDSTTIEDLAAHGGYHRLAATGIAFMGCYYGTDAELGRLRIKNKAANSKVPIYWNPLDLGTIQVGDGDRGFVVATATDRDRIGASLLDVELALIRENIVKSNAKRRSEAGEAAFNVAVDKAANTPRPARSTMTTRRKASSGPRSRGPVPGAAKAAPPRSPTVRMPDRRPVAMPDTNDTPDRAKIDAIRKLVSKGMTS